MSQSSVSQINILLYLLIKYYTKSQSKVWCPESRIFSNTPFNMRGNHFLVNRTEKEVPQCACILHLFKYVFIIILLKSQRFNTTFLDGDSCLNFTFRQILSNPKFCALVPLTLHTTYHCLYHVLPEILI